MAVVVGAPDVDGGLEAPLLQLVSVVGDVGGKVGVEPVGPAEHVVLQVQLVHLLPGLALPHVLLLEQFSGVEPQGAVLLIGPALVSEHAHSLGHIAALVEGGLQEPLVVLNLVPAQILLHLGDVALEAKVGHGLLALLLALVHPAVAVLGAEGGGQLADVVALIAVLGEGHVLLPQNELTVPGVDRHGELVDLVAGVVDIELPPYMIAGTLQHAGQAVAQHAAPGVADMHGPCGIGGDKLHHDLLAMALIHGAIGGALPLDVRDDLAVPAAAQAEIQKAGAGDLGALEVGPLQLQVVQDNLGDGSGGHVEGLGPRHGKGGRVVPMGYVLGNLNGGLYLDPGGQEALGGGLFIGRLGQGRHLVLGGLDHVGHLKSPHQSLVKGGLCRP